MESLEDILLNLKDIVSDFDDAAKMKENKFLLRLKEEKVIEGKRRVDMSQGRIQKTFDSFVEDIKATLKKNFDVEGIPENELRTIGGKIVISRQKATEKKKSQTKGQKTKRGRKKTNDSKMEEEEEEDVDFKKTLGETLNQFNKVIFLLIYLIFILGSFKP